MLLKKETNLNHSNLQTDEETGRSIHAVLVWFYCISTIVGYSMPNLLYIYKQFNFK